jgi:cell division protein FtsI/penicillin-binding protein 2
MSYQSPMMRRVKGTYGVRRYIPRKGLIRILLVIIGIIVGINLFSSFSNKSKGEKTGKTKAEKQKQDKIQKAENRKKNKEKKPPEKSSGESKVPDVKYALSFDDVSKLVRQNAVSLTFGVGTLNEGSRSYYAHYSLDSSLQDLGNRLFKQYHPKYGAVVAIDPTSGRVLSLLSYTNDSVPPIASDLYCKNIFPAASVFKTITASAAIEKAGYSSESIVRHVGRKSTLYKYQLSKDIANFTELPFEDAYAHSINAVFARIAMYVLGEPAILEAGNNLGFNCDIPFELQCEKSVLNSTDSTLSLAELASGFNEHTRMSALHGAMIAGAICENGTMYKPFYVDSMTSTDNLLLYKHGKSEWRTSLKEGTCRELRQMMRAVARKGTARKSFNLIRQTSSFDTLEYGGKTGSVDKDTTGRVDWFIGFVRNPDNKKERMAIGVVTVHGANWTVHSSYIAAEYFRNYIGQMRKKEKIRNDSLKTVLANKPETGLEMHAENYRK